MKPNNIEKLVTSVTKIVIPACLLIFFWGNFSNDSFAQVLYKAAIDRNLYKDDSRLKSNSSRIKSKVNKSFINLDSVLVIDFTKSMLDSSKISNSDRSIVLNHAEYFTINSKAVNRISNEKPDVISVIIEFKGKLLQLDMTLADLFTSEFEIQSNNPSKVNGIKLGISYQGIVSGENSIATFNFFPEEVSGFIASTEFGSINIGKLSAFHDDIYISYSDNDLKKEIEFSCGTESLSKVGKFEKLPLKESISRSQILPCVKLFWETRYNIYTDHMNSGQNVSNYVITIFNVYNAIFNNEEVGTKLNVIFIWTTPDPYPQNNFDAILHEFSLLRNDIFPSNLAHLLDKNTYNGVGGMAQGTGGLGFNSCSAFSYSPLTSSQSNYPGEHGPYAVFGQILGSVNPLPQFSVAVFTAAHETGHNLGSAHTHACVWNGNCTAIDGCPGSTEDFGAGCGGCPNPGNPSGGGTIMSYCVANGNSIDFSLGFGPQPREIIQCVVNNSISYECESPPNTCTDNFESNNTFTTSTSFFGGPLGLGSSDLTENANIGFVDDVDWYKVTLSTPGILTITLDDLPWDYDLELYGPEGSSGPAIAGSYNQSTTAETISYQYTLNTSTIYYVKIYPYFPDIYSNASCYSLRIQWNSPEGPCPDLKVIDQSSSQSSCSAGDLITLTFKESNIGNLSSDPNFVTFHLSSNNVLTPGQNGDIYLNEYLVIETIPPLSQTIELSKVIMIPASTNPGIYYLFFSADGDQDVDECNELNNFASVIITVSDSILPSETGYRYWFNNQFSQAISVTHTLGNIFLLEDSISTTTLPQGLHTFNIAFKDEDDLWSSTISSMFLKMTSSYPAGSARYDYWFDNNFNSRIVKTIPSTFNLFLIRALNMGSLSSGLHSFSIRLKPDGKHWSSTISSLFYKLDDPFPAGPSQYEYWFDQNYASKTNLAITSSTNLLLLDSLTTTPLSSGLHTFNIRFKPDGRHWSSSVSNLFYKIDDTYPAGGPHFEYWFDNSYSARVVDSITSTENLMILDSVATTGLSEGLHTFHVRSKPDGKHWSTTTSDLFYKVSDTDGDIIKYQYWFDTNFQDTITVSVPATENLQLIAQIDSMDIPNGLHSFHIRHLQNKGLWSSVTSDLFYKNDPDIPNNRIVKFVYWYDHQWQNAQTLYLPGLPNDSLTVYLNAEDLAAGDHAISMYFGDVGDKRSSIIIDTFSKTEFPIECPFNNKLFTAGIGVNPGTTFQWQVDTGSGYVNVVNDGIYAGAATDSLHLIAAPTSWYGNKYRCQITDSYGTTNSEEFTLRFSLIWDGSEGTAWEDPMNWGCTTVPDAYTDVYVNTGTPNYPEVNVSTSCRSLKLKPGALVMVKTGNALTLTGSN